jgi:hypothetical protein
MNNNIYYPYSDTENRIRGEKIMPESRLVVPVVDPAAVLDEVQSELIKAFRASAVSNRDGEKDGNLAKLAGEIREYVQLTSKNNKLPGFTQ